jgi:TRAP-type C4-dicarboxylate transport system substrate-binding protein
MVMSFNRLCSLISALLLAAAVASSAAHAQNRQFSFAYDQPKSSGYGVGAEMFNKKLMELSKGTLSINQYPGAQLGTEAQTLQKVQTGDIDFVLLSTANASTAQPESGVFSIHFIFRDEAHAIKVLGDAKVIAAMKELYAAKMKGAHMLGLGSQGLRSMYGKKAIEKVADLKGVKMRVQATVTEDETFRPMARRWCTCRSARSIPRCRPAWSTWPRTASTTT